MFIAIDMRPWAEPNYEKNDFFSLELLHAFFRNFPSDVFFLWTTGDYPLPDNLLFDEYDNTRVLHTPISSKDLHFYIQWFSGIEIDDLIETQAMKEGVLPWTERIDFCITDSYLPFLTEENCFWIQMGMSLQWFHSLRGKDFFVAQKKIQKNYELSSLVIAPSGFAKEEYEHLFAIPSEKIFISSAGIPQDVLPLLEVSSDGFWNGLPKTFFFVKAEDSIECFLAFRAFELLKTRFSNLSWELVMVEPFAGALHELYSKTEKIHILAPLSEDHFRQVLGRASAFINISTHDSVGKWSLLAMRLEIPTIASEFGALPEVLGDCALYFDPTKSRSLYAQMKALVESEELSKSLPELARVRSRDVKFFIDDIAIKIIEEAKKRI